MEKVLLVKPQTYMNDSGRSVGPVMNFYKLTPEDLIVAHDDKDIPAESVYVQKSTYSYNDYKNLMAQAEKIYKATESTDAAVTTAPDYLNEKVILTVPSISKETQNNLNKALGSALRIVIQ